jgi:hypothetical protein
MPKTNSTAKLMTLMTAKGMFSRHAWRLSGAAAAAASRRQIGLSCPMINDRDNPAPDCHHQQNDDQGDNIREFHACDS